MKKLLFILIVGLSLVSCKGISTEPKVVNEKAKSVRIHMTGYGKENYMDSFFILKAEDGHDYYTYDWGKDLLHYPDCKLCLSRVNFTPSSSSTIIHDTVYLTKKDTPVQKRVRLLCINDGTLVQQGRWHSSQTDDTNPLIEGKIYTTIVPVFVDNGDSVYYIDGIGQKLTHRFIKPY